MSTFHIHIKGQVQGVGFRPYIFNLAQRYQATGWVSNGADGVHIRFNDDHLDPHFFQDVIFRHLPPQAHIESLKVNQVSDERFTNFQIRKSFSNGHKEVRISPDFALCEACKRDTDQEDNPRYQYAFTTCTNCGPRYSIITNLPYDRGSTEMSNFKMCSSCEAEYENPSNRRFYSQTNSCPDCAIELNLYKDKKLSKKSVYIFWEEILSALSSDQVVAIKGIGGFILMTDAGNPKAIKQLRSRKVRPDKPFALMYPNLKLVMADFETSEEEVLELTSPASPIVLLKRKGRSYSRLDWEGIAPNLDYYGVMLPYAPLFHLIMKKYDRPVVATSANISGSPIIYNEQEAVEKLFAFSDFLVGHDRKIVVPQDDSVVSFAGNRRILLRRSRGFAPTWYGALPADFPSNWLALGAEMKSAFALSNKTHQITASQYLGNLESYDSQIEFQRTLDHLLDLLDIGPEQVFSDLHPDYFVRVLADRLSNDGIPVQYVQHHRAHFGSVLMENDLIKTEDPILGVIWDGAGYGEDGMIWGSEFFVYKSYEMTRRCHLSPFQMVLGDKMSKEPRLSALSLIYDKPRFSSLADFRFSELELSYYTKLLESNKGYLTTSMGRFFDAVASLTGIIDQVTFEGQAAMYLEASAREFTGNERAYKFRTRQGQIVLDDIVNALLCDLSNGCRASQVAYKFHLTLVEMISSVARQVDVKSIAFSGGVFQNKLLVELLQEKLSEDYVLYFHKELSPNDENIAVGQLACGYIKNLHDKLIKYRQKKTESYGVSQ